MLKSAFAVGFVLASLSTLPALAAAPMCDEATMTKMQTSVAAMTDASKKDMAMKEMDMAKEAMTKKDDATCVTHLEKIQGMM